MKINRILNIHLANKYKFNHQNNINKVSFKADNNNITKPIPSETLKANANTNTTSCKTAELQE